MLSVYILCFGYILNSQEKNLNPEWLIKDTENFISLSEYINKGDFNFESFTNEVINLSISNRKLLWPKYKSFSMVQSGGHTSNWITINTMNNTIFYMKVYINNADADILNHIAKNNIYISNELKTKWKLMKSKNSNCSVYEYTNDSLRKQFQKKVNSYLGNLDNVDPGKDLKESYDLLVNSSSFYIYNLKSYDKNITLKERIAIEKIIDAGRIDLIKNIIKGYNPEGRAYGIEAILRLNSGNKVKISFDVYDLLSKIKKIPFPISTRLGCFKGVLSYSEIINKFKNQI